MPGFSAGSNDVRYTLYCSCGGTSCPKLVVHGPFVTVYENGKPVCRAELGSPLLKLDVPSRTVFYAKATEEEAELTDGSLVYHGHIRLCDKDFLWLRNHWSRRGVYADNLTVAESPLLGL